MNCLGTLLRYRERPDVTITNVTISNGNKGGNYDPTVPYDEIAAIRIQEATAVAKALDGRYICLDQEDEYIRDTDQTRNRLADILRQARAELLNAAGVLSRSQAEYATASGLFDASLALYRELGDRHGVSNALQNLGTVRAAPCLPKRTPWSPAAWPTCP